MSQSSTETVALVAPEVLRTERLTLRRPRLEDAAALFEEYTHDAEATRYLSWRPNQSVEETARFLEGCPKRWQEGGEFVWVITVGAEDRPVGTIGCRAAGCKAGLGYALARRCWNQGLMSEAARAVSDWAIGCPRIFRVWACCDCENLASARVMEKCGMQREGILRRWAVLPNVSAEPRDCLVYSRVR